MIGQTAAAARTLASRSISRTPTRGIMGIHGMAPGKQGGVVTPLDLAFLSRSSEKKQKLKFQEEALLATQT